MAGERERLTADEVSWLRRLTGTYDADSSPGYYTMMDRLFDQVEADAAELAAKDKLLRDLWTEMGEGGKRGRACDMISKRMFERVRAYIASPRNEAKDKGEGNE